jgi:hypothetical protein
MSSVLGTVFSLLMIVSKLAANDFYYLQEYRAALPLLHSVLTAVPPLDLQRSLPALADWSWHAPWDHKAWIGYAPVNATVLVLIIVYRNRTIALLDRSVAWLYRGRPLRPRAMVFGCAACLLISYQTKTHLGFFLPGIGGWHYRDQGPTVQDRLPEPVTSDDREVLAEHPFLDRALIRGHTRFLAPRRGYIAADAMFLHFRDGDVLPANEELTDMVFPRYVFGPSRDQISRPREYFEIVQAALARRRTGRRFLLPIAVSYPNHIPYMSIDYTTYPSASSLERISFWQLWVEVGPDQRLVIVKANRKLVIDAP